MYECRKIEIESGSKISIRHWENWNKQSKEVVVKLTTIAHAGRITVIRSPRIVPFYLVWSCLDASSPILARSPPFSKEASPLILAAPSRRPLFHRLAIIDRKRNCPWSSSTRTRLACAPLSCRILRTERENHPMCKRRPPSRRRSPAWSVQQASSTVRSSRVSIFRWSSALRHTSYHATVL